MCRSSLCWGLCYLFHDVVMMMVMKLVMVMVMMVMVLVMMGMVVVDSWWVG